MWAWIRQQHTLETFIAQSTNLIGTRQRNVHSVNCRQSCLADNLVGGAGWVFYRRAWKLEGPRHWGIPLVVFSVYKKSHDVVAKFSDFLTAVAVARCVGVWFRVCVYMTVVRHREKMMQETHLDLCTTSNVHNTLWCCFGVTTLASWQL